MRWALASVATVGGCLYLGGINYEPEGRIEIEKSSAKLEWRGKVTLKAVASDPDDDELSYEWRVQVKALRDGKTYSLNATKPAVDSKGDFDESKPGNVDEQPPALICTESDLTLDPLPMRGTYTAWLRITDEHDAATTVQTTFEVANTAPSFKIELTVDPVYADQDRVPDHNGSYPVHAHYLARVPESGLVDLEKDLQCGGKGGVTWSILQPASDQVDYSTVKSCQAREVLDRLRFHLKAPLTGQSTKLVLQAKVKDGYGGEKSGTLEKVLAPNRPPCIQDTGPASLKNIKDGQEVSVPFNSGLLFSVVSFNDDADRYGVTFGWEVRDTGGSGSFQTIPGQTDPSLTIPPMFRLPGERFQLRVTALDAKGDKPTCGQEVALCSDTSSVPAACYRWVTFKAKID